MSSSAAAPLLDLHRQIASPQRIAAIQVLHAAAANGSPGGETVHLVRVITTDGAVGVAAANDRILYLEPILRQLVMPYFLAKDARDIEHLVGGVYLHGGNYKLAGLALWWCVACVEFAIFDLLGRVTGKPVGELLGGVKRRRIPVYLSSMRRDTTPEAETAWINRRVEELGGCAVKLKVGGRMSDNADAAPQRSMRLIALARKTLGDRCTIYVDANGSYDAPTAIAMGQQLAQYGVAWMEEPCPFDDLDAIKTVADALEMPVAAGEQETSLARFTKMARDRIVDVVQPDLVYNGGFARCLRVARWAAAAGLPTTVHSAGHGMLPVYMAHFASAVENPGPFQEFNAAPRTPVTWFAPTPAVRNGAIDVPTGPGLGVEIDYAQLSNAAWQ